MKGLLILPALPAQLRKKEEHTLKDSRKNGKRIKISPLAKKIAVEHGIAVETLTGTGPGGRIVKSDVLKAVGKSDEPASSPLEKRPWEKDLSPGTAVPSGFTPARIIPMEEKSIKVTRIRSIIAERLVESKTQIPHFYLQMEVNAEALLELRMGLNNNLNDNSPDQGAIKLTVNDFILKATAMALERVPAINSSWAGDTILQHGAVHLAFAVALEEGLVTPVIREAQSKSILEISKEAKELAIKAKNRKLTPEEMTGSTFTVTNLGMFGVNNFFGIINPPNAAILAVGAIQKKPVATENDAIAIRRQMILGLSCDHRTVDGAKSAQFLLALKEILEAPSILLDSS